MKFNTKIHIEIDNTLIFIILTTIIFKEVFIFFYYYFISYFFIVVHEFTHIFMAKILGINTNKIYFKLGGMCANIVNYTESKIKNVIILLSGPLSNLFIALIFINNEYIYKINMIFFIMNLIPLNPLDGYNLLNIINKNSIVNYIISYSIQLLLIFISLYFIYYKNNYMFLIILIYIINIKVQNMIIFNKNKLCYK